MVNSKNWYVLYVKSRHEKKIDLRLKQMGVNSFSPNIIEVSQWSDRKKKIERPLFPGYIFLKAEQKKDFHNALAVNGVFSILKHNNQYACIKEEEIETIKRIMELGEHACIDVTPHRPKVNERIKVCHGPLKGMECDVLNVNNKNKIVVNLEAINKYMTATIPVSYISPIVTI